MGLTGGSSLAYAFRKGHEKEGSGGRYGQSNVEEINCNDDLTEKDPSGHVNRENSPNCTEKKQEDLGRDDCLTNIDGAVLDMVMEENMTLNRNCSAENALRRNNAEGGKIPTIPHNLVNDANFQTTRSGTRINTDGSQLVPFDQTQVDCLPFPSGCKVCHFEPDGENYICGTITGASFMYRKSCRIYYSVLFDNGETSWCRDNELAYAPNSPVIYSPSTFADTQDDSVKGEILLCLTKPLCHKANLDLVKRLKGDLVLEVQLLTKPNSVVAGRRILVEALERLNKVSMDHLTLKLTEIEHVVKSVSELKPHHCSTCVSMANKLIGKWHQMNIASSHYYSVSTIIDGKRKMIHDIPSSQVSYRNYD